MRRVLTVHLRRYRREESLFQLFEGFASLREWHHREEWCVSKLNVLWSTHRNELRSSWLKERIYLTKRFIQRLHGSGICLNKFVGLDNPVKFHGLHLIARLWTFRVPLSLFLQWQRRSTYSAHLHVTQLTSDFDFFGGIMILLLGFFQLLFELLQSGFDLNISEGQIKKVSEEAIKAC